MATLTLRDCDTELDQALKETSKRQGKSVNRYILEILHNELLGANKKPRRHDDLAYLAGTWSQEDADSFAQATASFAAIDQELWT